ncbi:MAG: type II secretion system F family protein [Candidatus Omnitrophica bacterium]|nr:type II secretion system F family protein [Candidatus Omnitrophota bacterium]
MNSYLSINLAWNWAVFVWFMAGLIVFTVGFLALAYVISLPLRRHERARFFLDLLETGLKTGRGIEQTLVEISRSRDRSVGVRFHWLAAQLESGLRLGEALGKVPGLLPPQVLAMLRVGEKTGNLAGVLPACRQYLKDGMPQFIKAQNYLTILPFLGTPIVVPLVTMLSVTYVLPRLIEIMKDADFEAPVPMLTGLLIRLSQGHLILAFDGVLLGIAGLFGLAVVFYLGGPRCLEWLEAGLPPLSDWIFQWVPWRRKRMQRDFCAMLGTLLDAGMPEVEAVALAAQCTANRCFVRRALAVVDELGRGVKLTEAVRHLDVAGEFRWRLTNACRGGGEFGAALKGWQEALDAQAFQEEQAFAQVFTTILVLVNGLLVGFIVIAAFQPLIALTNAALLW